MDDYLTEAIDVFSLGNVLYALLTGTRVWLNYSKEDRIYNIVEGITQHIPDSYNNTPSSRLLVEAIQKCWTYDVEERPSIFWLVEFLTKAVAEYPVVDEMR